jgi:hypothetical protein
LLIKPRPVNLDFNRSRQVNFPLSLGHHPTDGSELYPKPLHKLWPDVPHQVCEFHVLKQITKAVLHALATTRKELRDRIPKLPRGRPRKAERAQSRKAARQQKQVSELFEHRHLFVRHRLTADQKKTLQRITRGLAHLRRLREIMEEVYRLFDRRCRTETALARLAQLRQRVSRFKRLGRALNKLSSPDLEKALTFLDDKLLPATSNVGLGHRGHHFFGPVGTTSVVAA